MDKHIIIGVHIENREEKAVAVQNIFTKYGNKIKTRLGLHDDINASNGLILLEMNDCPEASEMIEALTVLGGVDTQQMIFNH